MEDIKELILASRQGKEDAFVKIVEQYNPLLHSMSRKFFAMCQDSGEDEDDFLQEAKVALYSATLSFEIETEGVTFGAYAKRCIRNKLVSFVRRLKSKKRQSSISRELKDDEADNSTSQAGSMLEKELLSQAESILSGFEKQIFSMYLDGMKAKEISKRLNKSIRSINNAIYRVRVKIKRMVNETT